MNSRRKESIKLICLLIFSLLVILTGIIAIAYHIGTKQCTCTYEIQAKEYDK